MLDIKYIRENPEEVKKGIQAKKSKADIDAVLVLDEKRRKLQNEIDTLRQGRHDKAEDREAARQLKEQIKAKETELKELETKLEDLLLVIPNIPDSDVPIGKNEEDNLVLREVGDKRNFSFKPKDYLSLGEALDIIDVKTAAEVSGTRFGYLKGEAALLQFALIQYAMNVLTNEGILKKIVSEAKLNVSTKPFIPVVPPAMIKPEVYRKMARLDKGQEEERYYIPSDDIYLTGSAEHTLGPMHMNHTFSQTDLPVRYVGYNTAFRREAGSYGKDTKGILRVHQFDKVEMESFCLPENSREEHNFIVACQEYLLRTLGVPYRVVSICTGDMGGPDARQIDLESWMPGQGTYRETHTADLMTDYQARRLQTRVKIGNKTELVHMIDATAYAIGRTLIAIIENYQQEDGTILIPDVLQPYMGGKKIIGNIKP